MILIISIYQQIILLFHTLEPEFNTNRNTANMNLEIYQCLCRRRFSCWPFRSLKFPDRLIKFKIFNLFFSPIKYSYWSMECYSLWHNRTLSLHNIFSIVYSLLTMVSHSHIVKCVTEFFPFRRYKLVYRYIQCMAFKTNRTKTYDF